MAEYQVKFKASVGFIFPATFESMEIYEADTAKEAKQKCESEFRRMGAERGIDPDEAGITFVVTDIKKI